MQVDRDTDHKGNARSQGHAQPQGRKRAARSTQPIRDHHGRSGSRQAQSARQRRRRQRNRTTEVNGYRRRQCIPGKHDDSKHHQPDCHTAIPQVTKPGSHANVFSIWRTIGAGRLGQPQQTQCCGNEAEDYPQNEEQRQ
jgi:hypothetical protein